jgi:hypothetical protein
VCDRCLDTPQQQLRAIIVTADPLPIINARPEQFAPDEAPTGTNQGPPYGVNPLAQMPLVAGQQWAVPLSIVSVLSNGTTTITVNTNGPHGLSTNAQVSVQGLSNIKASAEASINVVTSTQFTYLVSSAIPTASLANINTRVIVLNAGLAYNQTTLPTGA